MGRRRARRGWGKIRSLPSGKFQASYVWPPHTVRHVAPVTFGTRLDAEMWLGKERRLIEREDGNWTPPALRAAERKVKAVTVADYAEEWIAQRNIKERSRLHYGAILAKHIKDTGLGRTPLQQLTSDTVRAWYASLDPKHPTIRSHAYGLLHAVCATAVKDGLLASNPCQIERAMKTPRKRRPVILDVAEVAALADAIAPERFKAFILISAWCGLRYGEVIELRRKDIGKDATVITVARGVTHRDGCRIDTPKSGRGRVVVVPPHIRADIKTHLNTFVAKGADAQLFPPARGGCHLNDKVFREHFNTALDAIGRDNVRLHDLRHFAGTQAARVGNLRETMDRLGHSTVAASLIYQQAVSGRDAAVAEALSELAATDTPTTR